MEHCDLLKTEVISLAPRATSEALSLAIYDLVPGYLTDLFIFFTYYKPLFDGTEEEARH